MAIALEREIEALESKPTYDSKRIKGKTMKEFKEHKLKVILIMLIIFFLVGVNNAADAEKLPTRELVYVCHGEVLVDVPADDTFGTATIALSDECVSGRYFITSESKFDREPVIVNGWLHQGYLVIRLNRLQPLGSPSSVVVNWLVVPD